MLNKLYNSNKLSQSEVKIYRNKLFEYVKLLHKLSVVVCYAIFYANTSTYSKE